MTKPWKKTRREFLRDGALLGAAAAAAPGVLAACASGGQSSTGTGKPTRKNTLYVGGWQWGPPTSFSPLGSTPMWPTNPTSPMQYVYECLYGFNMLDGNIEPILAKGPVNWVDQTTAVVSLQQGAHFHDGKPVTADDVVYTFELAKRHTEIRYANFWDYVQSVTKKDDHTVQFALNKERLNPGEFRHFLAYTFILPKHVYSAVETKRSSLLAYVDMQPVGSGPYKVMDASPQRVALIRDDGYWGKDVHGMPAPAYIIHPIFKSNDDSNLAFQRGELDISQTFLPQIWQMWEDKHLPVGTWFKQPPYHLPGSIPMIWLNPRRKGLDNVKVRQAIAYAIDYANIVETAMSRYSPVPKSSLVVPQGHESKFFNAGNASSLGWTHNPQKAVQILESDLGAKKGGDGIYVLPDGTRLGPYTAQCPYGWTDWQASLQVVSQSAKQVGIDIGTNFPEAPQVTTAVQNGDFDIAMWGITGADPAAPWARFRDVLDSRGVPAPGQTAFWDYVRFQDSTVGSLLDQAAAASPSEQPALYAQLDKIFMQNVPVIPLEYRPQEFYEYNESVWTGFPNSSNPWAPPQQSGAGIKILTKIKNKG
jgi:peptide/nickel transport system substrate-binding protein